METPVIVALIGSAVTLMLGLHNARSSAKKTELEQVKEDLKKCHGDREMMMAENRQLSRENMTFARQLLEAASKK